MLQASEAAPRRGILGSWLAAASHTPADLLMFASAHVPTQAPWTSMFQQDDEVERLVVGLFPCVFHDSQR